MANKDGLFIELQEVRSVMGSISPKLSTYKNLQAKEKELLKKIHSYDQ